MMKRILTPVLFILLLTVLLAGSSDGASASASSVADRGADSTPPEAYIRARKRQDMDNVFKRGIQATCGTDDDEQPLVCTMTASRKGRVLASGTGSFDRPYNRYHFNLRLSAADKDRFRDVDHSVDVKLRLRATDEAGNKATVTKRIRVVDGLWGS